MACVTHEGCKLWTLFPKLLSSLSFLAFFPLFPFLFWTFTSFEHLISCASTLLVDLIISRMFPYLILYIWNWKKKSFLFWDQSSHLGMKCPKPFQGGPSLPQFCLLLLRDSQLLDGPWVTSFSSGQTWGSIFITCISTIKGNRGYGNYLVKLYFWRWFCIKLMTKLAHASTSPGPF